jgi:predicted nucleotidyltransferase
MSVTAEETLSHLGAIQRASRLRADARASRLRERLPEARRLLVDEFGARGVWLFGSLANDTATEASDVDLAVAELPPAAYFKALAALMELFGGRVDLVRIEEADESLRGRIEGEGSAL